MLRPTCCIKLPFDDSIEAIERTFEAAETQFAVRAHGRPLWMLSPIAKSSVSADKKRISSRAQPISAFRCSIMPSQTGTSSVNSSQNFGSRRRSNCARSVPCCSTQV